MSEESATGSLITVTDETFADTVLAAERPVVVDFWATWCRPCIAIEKSLKELAEELGDRMIITKINADENPVTAMKYGVRSLPTLLVLRQGEVIGSIIGAKPKSSLRQALLAPLEP